jgi:inosine/xanthosine triphosphate pyrophosphatase family protein
MKTERFQQLTDEKKQKLHHKAEALEEQLFLADDVEEDEYTMC